jgi:hypothetical protein
MTASIFPTGRNIRKTPLPPKNKIALIIDNCSAPVFDVKNTAIKFFPPNTTRIVHPYDQGTA